MLSKAEFIGFITHDLKKQQMKDANGEYSCVNFQLAINHNNDNENKKVSFFNMTAFRTQADNIFNYLCKGSKVFIEAFITNMLTKDPKTGEDKKYFNIIVKNCVFLETKEQTDLRREKLTPPKRTSNIKVDINDNILSNDELLF